MVVQIAVDDDADLANATQGYYYLLAVPVYIHLCHARRWGSRDCG